MLAPLPEGVYYGLPEADYHADPCDQPSLSAGIAKIILADSPRHAWHAHPRLNPGFEKQDTERFDIGKAAHSLLLGDHREFVVVDAEDWRTKFAKEARDQAYKDGKTPMLTKHWNNVRAMVESAKVQLSAHECANFLAEGESEVTLIWKEGDVWCRCRIDRMVKGGVDFYDYKTTDGSANPAEVARLFFGNGYDVTHAFYRRGIRKLLGVENPAYRFVMQETYRPHALSVIGLPPGAAGLADRKVEEAIRLWDECSRAGRWPAYPNRTAYVEMPIYLENAWLEREAREESERKDGANPFSNTIAY